MEITRKKVLFFWGDFFFPSVKSDKILMQLKKRKEREGFKRFSINGGNVGEK